MWTKEKIEGKFLPFVFSWREPHAISCQKTKMGERRGEPCHKWSFFSRIIKLTSCFFFSLNPTTAHILAQYEREHRQQEASHRYQVCHCREVEANFVQGDEKFIYTRKFHYCYSKVRKFQFCLFISFLRRCNPSVDNLDPTSINPYCLRKMPLQKQRILHRIDYGKPQNHVCKFYNHYHYYWKKEDLICCADFDLPIK